MKGKKKTPPHATKIYNMLNTMVAIAFQITFCAEIHDNNIFFNFLNIIFDISILK